MVIEYAVYRWQTRYSKAYFCYHFEYMRYSTFIAHHKLNLEKYIRKVNSIKISDKESNDLEMPITDDTSSEN